MNDGAPSSNQTDAPEDEREERRLDRAAKRLRSLSFNRIFPNILTVLAMCAGLTAIRYGMTSDWDRAVIALVIAAMLDGVDGRVARMLRSTTKFGAELDSLADAISFGVAPALVMYQWVMNDAGSVGWALCLLHVVCCVLRLARFNTMVGQPDLPAWAHNYFTGVPAPGGAGITIMPLILWLYTGSDIFADPIVVGVFLLGSAILMVSRVPVYSGKHVRLKPFLALPLMILIGVTAGFLVTDPFATLSFVGAAYLISIAASSWSFRRLQARSDKAVQ